MTLGGGCRAMFSLWNSQYFYGFLFFYSYIELIPNFPSLSFLEFNPVVLPRFVKKELTHTTSPKYGQNLASEGGGLTKG